jgi:hypothetical protein
VVVVWLQPGYTARPATDVLLPFVEPVVLGVDTAVAQSADLVKVTGRNFSPKARVLLINDGGVEISAEVTSVSDDGETLVFKVPKADPVNYRVVVCNPEGQASGEAFSISVITLVLGDVAPTTASAGGGTLVILEGLGFETGVDVELVDDKDVRVAVDVTYIDSTEVRFVAPAHSPGFVDIVATNPGREPITLVDGLEYLYGVQSVSPNQVPEGGGTLITVQGDGFGPNVAVTVRTAGGDFKPSVTVVDAGTLTFLAPPANPGDADVIVTNPGLEPLLVEDALTYLPSLKVSTVTPSTSATTGGTLITVTGTGFLPGLTAFLRAPSTADAPVAPGGLTSTSFTFMTPVHAAGDVNLVLQNVGELAVTVPDAITFTNENESRFFSNATSDIVPVLSQSGDRFMATRGAIVDLNLDGLNDIVLQSTALLPEGASLRILHQDADGEFADDTHRSIPDRFGGFATAADVGEGPGLAVGDIDGDSFPDILVASTGFVPRTQSGRWGTSAYVVGTDSVVDPYFFSDFCGKVGEFPIFWNDNYPVSRVLRNDGIGNFFSSPFGAEGRRIPRVGFFVEDGPSIAADLLSYQATLTLVTEIFETAVSAVASSDANGTGDSLLKLNGDISELPTSGTVTVTFNIVVGGETLTQDDVYQYIGKSDADRTLTIDGTLQRDYTNGESAMVEYDSFESSMDQGFVDNPFVRGGERFEGDALALGDLDGDGVDDLVVGKDSYVIGAYRITFQRGAGLDPFDTWTSEARPSTRVLLNGTGSARGSFTESAFPLLDPSGFAFPDTGYGDHGQASDIALGDVNGDDLLDIVAVSDRRFEFVHDRTGDLVTEYKTGTRIFLNRGEGLFDDATRSNLPVVDVAPTLAPDFFAASRVVLGDVDLDGDLDMVLASDTGNHIVAGRPLTRVLINRNGPSGGTGLFDDESTTRMPAVSGDERWQARSVALHDIDGDGDADLVLTSGDPALVDGKAGTRVLVNNGFGVFQEFPTGVAADTYIPRRAGAEDWSGDLVLVGDLNNDGVADILISEETVTQDATRILIHK